MKQAMKRGMQTQRNAPALRRQAQGMSLIEVLVSVLVLSLGLMGIAAMQAMALRGGQSSLESSQAVMQASSLFEAMRANRDNAAAYNTGKVKVCSVASISGTTLAKNDLKAWLTAMKSSIGTAGDATTCGQVTGCPGNCRVTVFWDDSRGGVEAGLSTRSMALEAAI